MASDLEKPSKIPTALKRIRRRPIAITGVICSLILLLFYSTPSHPKTYLPQTWSLPLAGSQSYPRKYDSGSETYVELSPFELPRRLDGPAADRQPRLRVAVLEHAGFHDEVIGAVLKTLEDVGMNYTVYRDDWRWGYENILSPFLPKPAKRINRGSFANHVKERRYDLVIHVSCDYAWRDRMPGYIGAVMQEADYLHVICVQHELENLQPRERDVWMDVVGQNRFSLMTMSPHTTRHLGKVVQKWAIQTGNLSWGNVGVDTLVPVFPMDPASLRLDEDAKVPLQVRDPNQPPARIAILGNVHTHRRNYQGIMDELMDAIEDHPEAWGYRAPIGGIGRYLPTNDPSHPPVTLHFVGSKPSNTVLHIPKPIEHLIEIHSDLEYTDFYRLIASMDLIVPAFTDFVYVDLKLSSAIPAAIISKVPILATPLLLESYSFLRPPALILHPSGMTEVAAIGLLRQGIDPMAYLPHIPAMLPTTQPESLFSSIWRHGPRDPRQSHGIDSRALNDEWERYHKTLYDANALMMRKLLLEIEDRKEIDAIGES